MVTSATRTTARQQRAGEELCGPDRHEEAWRSPGPCALPALETTGHLQLHSGRPWKANQEHSLQARGDVRGEETGPQRGREGAVLSGLLTPFLQGPVRPFSKDSRSERGSRTGSLGLTPGGLAPSHYSLTFSEISFDFIHLCLLAARPAHRSGGVLMNSSCSPFPSTNLSWRRGTSAWSGISAELPLQASVPKKECPRLRGALRFKMHSRPCRGTEATYHPPPCQLHLTTARWPVEGDVTVP